MTTKKEIKKAYENSLNLLNYIAETGKWTKSYECLFCKSIVRCTECEIHKRLSFSCSNYNVMGTSFIDFIVKFDKFSKDFRKKYAKKLIIKLKKLFPEFQEGKK